MSDAPDEQGSRHADPKEWGRIRRAILRRVFGRATEAPILFPAIAVLVLGVIWVTTINLVEVERANAERAAAAASRELVETYEAQVVRALREIDHTLKLVKYAYELKEARIDLAGLKGRALLPPDILFVVGVTNSTGDVIASTRTPERTNLAGQDFFQTLRRTDTLAIGRPQPGLVTGDWRLIFGRRLNAADGAFAGAVTIAVDAAYFVSGYEPSKLGNRGVLAILGTDGVFWARRSGESVSAGETADYASAAPDADQPDPAVALVASPWDGVRRYTGARRLFEFPAAVIVGLAEDEQLAGAQRNIRAYLWTAAAGSGVLVLVVAVLGRMSWQLAQSRLRAVQEQVAHAERVQYLAYHDGLTSLPNRSLFSKLLNQSIAEANRYGRRLAVLFLDLDRFKHVNDTLGHETGDQLLQQVASRLRTCLRGSDTVARLGGDEFVVLLPDSGEQKYAATVAQKVLSAIAAPFVLLGQEFRVTASVGISTYPKDGQDEQTLTKHADIAMYRAKEEGKNNFQFFSEQLSADSLERLTLESSLRRALERGEFELHYQAKRALRSGQITGMEALLRWKHPDLGTVAPMQFIPLAEEIGLMVPIGKWVLRSACLQNVAWRNQGLPRIDVAVNLTPRQFFDDRLLPDLASILEASGMDAQSLELEFTESLLMHDVERALRVLTGLKNMGVRIAIDDFGIGYFSLSMLKRFPLDTIKIDRSLIREVTGDAGQKDLTRAILAISEVLSLTVVAQGVETKEQADMLRQQACDQFQGFYINKPLPAEQVVTLLRSQAGSADDNGVRQLRA